MKKSTRENLAYFSPVLGILSIMTCLSPWLQQLMILITFVECAVAYKVRIDKKDYGLQAVGATLAVIGLIANILLAKGY